MESPDIKINKSEIEKLESRYRAKLINSITGHKSAHLVGTINKNGQVNLAILSNVFHLGANPALIGMIFRPDISPRHSLINIRETKLCTLNHVNKEIFKNAHQTSARYAQDVSEFDECQLTSEFISDFTVPFVKESNIKVALKLEQEIQIEINATHMLIFSIEAIYMNNNYILSDGNLDLEAANSVCVGGLESYYDCTLLERLPYAKPDKNILK